MRLEEFKSLVRDTFETLDRLENNKVVVDILPEFGIEVGVLRDNVDKDDVLDLLLEKNEEELRQIVRCNKVALAILEDEYTLKDLIVSLKYSHYYDKVKKILDIVEEKNQDYLKVFYEEVYKIIPECFDYNKNTEKGYVKILYTDSKEDTSNCTKSLVMGYVITTVDSIFEVCKDWRMYYTSRIVKDFPIEIDDDKYRDYAINI